MPLPALTLKLISVQGEIAYEYGNSDLTSPLFFSLASRDDVSIGISLLPVL